MPWNVLGLQSYKTEDCIILTFLNFDNGKDKPRVRVDCVSPFKADATADRHRQDGFIELQDSRSQSFSLADSDKIRVYLKGNIRLPKGVPKTICILKFFKHATSNHITFPVERVRSNHYYAELEFNVEKLFLTYHVRFDLKKKRIRNLLKLKEKGGDKGTILSEHSLTVLAHQVVWKNWEAVGLRLGLSQDALDDINSTEESDRRPVRLLNIWIGECDGWSKSEMVEELSSALEDNGEPRVAEVIWRVMEEHRNLEPCDFFCEQSQPKYKLK